MASPRYVDLTNHVVEQLKGPVIGFHFSIAHGHPWVELGGHSQNFTPFSNYQAIKHHQTIEGKHNETRTKWNSLDCHIPQRSSSPHKFKERTWLVVYSLDICGLSGIILPNRNGNQKNTINPAEKYVCIISTIIISSIIIYIYIL